MYKGKSTCRELKRIRKMIAEQNNIPLEDSECHYEGDCAGTCPKCDAEVRFLENALRKSKQLGKVVTLSGAALAFSACGNQVPVETIPETTDSIDSAYYENAHGFVISDTDSSNSDEVNMKTTEPSLELDIIVGDVITVPYPSKEEAEELMEIEELPEEEEEDFQE